MCFRWKQFYQFWGVLQGRLLCLRIRKGFGLHREGIRLLWWGWLRRGRREGFFQRFLGWKRILRRDRVPISSRALRWGSSRGWFGRLLLRVLFWCNRRKDLQWELLLRGFYHSIQHSIYYYVRRILIKLLIIYFE